MIKSADGNCGKKIFFFSFLLVISCCRNCSKSMNDTEFRKKSTNEPYSANKSCKTSLFSDVFLQGVLVVNTKRSHS